MDRNREEHPSWGLVQVSHVSVGGGGVPMFDSTLTHSTLVTLKITRANREWNLHQRWIHPTTHIVKVAMTSTQWAQMLSTPNNGVGTPCTIEWVAGEGRVEPCPPDTTQDSFQGDVGAAMTDALGTLRTFAREAKTLKASSSQKKVAEVVALAETVERELLANMPFIQEQYQRMMQAEIARAKAEFEAYVQASLHERGLQALSGGQPQLEALPGELVG